MRRLLLLALLVLSGPAGALEIDLGGRPLRLDFTESLYLNAHLDPGNGDPARAYYGELVNRLNVQASLSRWRLGLRLDSTLFVDAPYVGQRLAKANCPDCIGTVSESDLRDRFQQTPWDRRKGLEKISLSYLGKELEATLGDYYAQLGRGLVLSLRKVDELGVDTTLFGAKVAWRKGPVSTMAFAGFTNIQNVDDTSGTYIRDPDDLIGGARVEGRLFDKVLVAVQGAGGLPSENRSLLTVERDQWARYGASVEVPRIGKYASFYLEAARADARLNDEREQGSGIYAAVTGYAGDVTLLLEAKDYRHFAPVFATHDRFGVLAYQQAPTLERVVTQLTTNADVTAARLRADWRLAPSLVLFASGEGGVLSPTELHRYTLVDLYAGAQVRWDEGRSHAFPLLGWRRETDEAGAVAEQLWAAEWDVSQALSTPWSVETSGLVWHRTKGNETIPGSGDNTWLEGNAYIAIKRAPHVVVAAGYEFTTLPKESLNRHHFINGSVQWNVRSDTALRVFAGGQRPGLRCISGLCRDFPAFSGVRAEVVLRR